MTFWCCPEDNYEQTEQIMVCLEFLVRSLVCLQKENLLSVMFFPLNQME